MDEARYPIVEVLWDDSARIDDDAWTNTDELKEILGDLGHRSIGFLVAETDEAIALARSISEWASSERAEGVLAIPKVCIIERKDR